MGFFKEKEGYIDYTLLKKKGLLKTEESSNEIIDFTNTSSTSPSAGASAPIFPSSNSSNESNPFGFLDNVASTSSSTNQSNEPSTYYSNTNTRSNSIDTNKEISALRIKMDDLEYKIERLLEKISLVESKLTNFEGKVIR